ncbi:MAG: rhodanese-like domain-containing protein [Thermodesulfobacteriota bacterium]
MNFTSILKGTGPALALTALLLTGCATGGGGGTKAADASAPAAPAAAATQKKQQKVYKGKVVGKSNKAKQISIQVGKGAKAKTVMVSFDEATTGVEHASKGHAAIIAYEMRDGKPFATNIKPKLAKLPPGVEKISAKDVKALQDKNADFLLVDSRPGKRYAASHLPGSISIPVCEMQELLQNLPKDKNKLLVFYCGGPT